MPNEGGGGRGGLGSGGNYQKPHHSAKPSRPGSRGGPLPARSYTYSPPARKVVRQAPRPQPLNRPAASRENRPNATRPAPKPSTAARNELFQRRLLALSMLSQGPAPSPDRTTGRELAGFASTAFTGKELGDGANAFEPASSGRGAARYGAQAGNPKQQALAAETAGRVNAAPVRDLEQILSQSPVGTVAGSVVANRTWAKLAPLFGRNPNKPPEVTFKNTPLGTGGYAKDGKVTVNPTNLTSLFVSPKGRQTLAGLLAHEFAHTQQAPAGDWRRSSNPARKGGSYSPTLEGGADAFRAAAGALLGYHAVQPNSKTDYGRAQQAFMQGSKSARVNLPKTLIQQFPRVRKRMGQ